MPRGNPGIPKKQFCPQKHDTFVTGRTKQGVCRICQNQNTEKRRKLVRDGLIVPAYSSIKPICRNDHDTLIVGRDKAGACNECRRLRAKKLYEDDKYAIDARNKVYYESHKDMIRIRLLKYDLQRLKTDIKFKLKKYLRKRVYQAIKNNQKTGSAVKDLGCSISELKQYIESKFYGKMSWDNWGDVWELDHIKELHKFDLTDRKQFLEVVNYKNLQPLTIEDHRKKTNKNII